MLFQVNVVAQKKAKETTLNEYWNESGVQIR
jgi:hypothetical protein